MASLLLETQHSSFDDFVKVNPFRKLIKDLTEEITDENFMSLIVQSKDKLGAEYGRIAERVDIPRFFDVLERKFSESNMVEYLINLFECEGLHGDEGRYADRIRQYKEEKAKYIQECAAKGIHKDPNFVGRQDQFVEALACFRPNSKYKGVILCGLGGMGKTTLAHEICFSLKHSQEEGREALTLYTVDLREKGNIEQLFKSLLTSLDDHYVPSESDSPYDLLQHIKKAVETVCTKRSVIFLDNADSVVQSDFDGVHEMLSTMLAVMRKMGGRCQSKVLITMRQKFCHLEETNLELDERVNGQLKEFELSELRNEECVRLLRQCSKLDDKVLSEHHCTAVADLCGRSPMAIRIIAGMLQDGFDVEEVIQKLYFNEKSLSQKLKVEACLKESFMYLGKELQTLLVNLSLFSTAKFDLRAAVSVGEEDDGAEERDASNKVAERKRIRDRNRRKMKWKLIELKQRHLIEFVEYPEEINKSDITRFSLHPLVWKFVAEVSKEAEIQLKIGEAKKRFLAHFVDVINECGKKGEVQPLTVTRLLEDNSIHLLSFFRYFINDIYSLKDLGGASKSEGGMMLNERIKTISELVLDAERQKLFFRRQAEQMEKAGDMYGYIYWRCQEADSLLSQDRIELAEKVLERLEQTAGLVTSGGAGGDQQPVEICGGEFGPYSGDQLSESTVPAMAAFHKVKASCYKHREMFDRALEHYQVAEMLYGGTNKEVRTLLRSESQEGPKLFRKRDFFRDLADVQNSIGSVYFKKGDITLSCDYHEKALATVAKIRSTPFHMDVPTYNSNIASCYHQRGLDSEDPFEKKTNLEKARRMYDSSVRCDKVLGKEMTLTHVNTLRNRANVLYYLGEPEQALKDARHSLDLRKQIVRPPNIELTQALIQVASFYYKVGKKRKEALEIDQATENFEMALQFYDEAQIHVKNGGLPMQLNDYRDYRDLKADHMRLLTKDLRRPARDIARVKKIYRKFEDGKYSRMISRHMHFDTDADYAELYKRAQESGQEFQFEEFHHSDSSDNDVSTPESVSTEDSSEAENEDVNGKSHKVEPRLVRVQRRDSGMEIEPDAKESVENEVEDSGEAKGVEMKMEDSTTEKEGGDGGPLDELRCHRSKAVDSGQTVQTTKKSGLIRQEALSLDRNLSDYDGSSTSTSSSANVSQKRSSSRSLASTGSQGSVSSILGRLMTLHSRSQDDEVFMNPTDTGDRVVQEPEIKKTKKEH